jgi:hypothetical protein
MPAADTRYDFDASILHELHAAQVRLRSDQPVPDSTAGGRRPVRLALVLAGTGALTAAAATAGVIALSSHPSPMPMLGPPKSAPGPGSGVIVKARLTASLAAEPGYMITSKVTQNSTGQTLTSWIDPATGNRRLLLTNAAGVSEVAVGVVIHGAKATVTTVDYAARTATTTTERAAVISNDARLGVNVPSPSDIRHELRSATLVNEGQVIVDGHHTYRMRMTVPPGSQRWFPGDKVELYVDRLSYQLVRTTISRNGTLQDTDDLTWTPRSTANLSQTKVTIPAGFTSH